MKAEVTKEKVVITEYDCINEGELYVNSCEFSLPECFDGLNVTAVFNNIPVPVIDNRCVIPGLANGSVEMGIYAYAEADGDTELMYSPMPAIFFVNKGSYTGEVAVEKIPTITEYEQFCHGFTEQLVNALSEDIAEKQPILVSGENIKTLNGESLLGSGDIVIDGNKNLINVANLVLDCLNNVAWASTEGETKLNALKSYIAELEIPEDEQDVPVVPDEPETDEDGFETVKVISDDEISHLTGYTEKPPYYQSSRAERETYVPFDVPVEYGYTYKFEYETNCTEKVLLAFQFYNQTVLGLVAENAQYSKSDTDWLPEWIESGDTFTLSELNNGSTDMVGVRITFKKEDETDFAEGAGVTSINIKRKVTE